MLGSERPAGRINTSFLSSNFCMSPDFMPYNSHHINTKASEAGMNEVLARNIRTLLEKRREEERKASVEQKVADSITRFTGSMRFVYLHAIFFGLWILTNLGWFRFLGAHPFDPSFVVLAMIASVEAIFLSTFILISQNRMNATSERRADLRSAYKPLGRA
jgi:uncharacterized membrane protein